METDCGIILLAAGASSRLGRPKQLLLYNGSTLLDYSLQQALQSMADQVVLVLGAGAADLDPGIKDDRLLVVINSAWQEGIAASIRCGLEHLLQKKPAIQRALFMVCDQPFVNAALLNKLVTLQKEKGYAIVSARYAETTGIPAVFDKQLFPQLLELTGDAGAKKLIRQQLNAGSVDFLLGNIDIDTAADYSMLKKI